MENPDNDPARTLPPVPRASANRAPPVTLPADAAASAAMVLRFIQLDGSTAFERSAAIEAARLRIDRLQDADPDVALSELAGHASILDALFQRFSVKAVQEVQTDAAAKFAKLALHAQGAYTRTLIAVEGLKQQRRGAGKVVIDNDNARDDDSSPE